jgi:succinate-acetate transporter protein
MDPSPASHARIMLRPIATPFPLGFLALATASLLVAGQELHWLPKADHETVALALIAFAFPLQLLASIFGFLGRDTVAATGFGVQGATWLFVGLSQLSHLGRSTDHGVGLLLIASSGWVLLCALGASLGKLGVALVLTLTAGRFLLTGLYELIGSSGLEHAAGILGLVLVGVATYVALALEVENLRRQTVLPVGRRGRGADALRSPLSDQLRSVEHEAGVREQL